MLRVWFGPTGLELKDRVANTSGYFDGMYEQSWLQSDLARQIISDVDKSTYVSGEFIESPILGGISPRDLSTGCKTLLILLNDDCIVSGDRMGDNCFPWLMKIAEHKDITITLCHYVELQEPFKILNLNNGKVLESNLDLFCALHDFDNPLVAEK